MRIGGRQGISATAADIAGLNSSFLYVISDGHGHVKIDVTEDPKSRIAALRRESAASTLDFVYIGATSSDGFDIEQAARSALARHRFYGEWLSVPPEMAVAAIARAWPSDRATQHRAGRPCSGGGCGAAQAEPINRRAESVPADRPAGSGGRRDAGEVSSDLIHQFGWRSNCGALAVAFGL